MTDKPTMTRCDGICARCDGAGTIPDWSAGRLPCPACKPMEDSEAVTADWRGGGEAGREGWSVNSVVVGGRYTRCDGSNPRSIVRVVSADIIAAEVCVQPTHFPDVEIVWPWSNFVERWGLVDEDDASCRDLGREEGATNER